MNDDAGVPSDIARLEERLRVAMLAGDVAALNDLLADDLVFTDQNGVALTKSDDLAAHRSGLLKIERLDCAGTCYLRLGNCAIVTTRATLAGHYADQVFEGVFAYTRVWSLRGGAWKVQAAHCSAVNGATVASTAKPKQPVSGETDDEEADLARKELRDLENRR